MLALLVVDASHGDPRGYLVAVGDDQGGGATVSFADGG
jgi:hypothetical protein